MRIPVKVEVLYSYKYSCHVVSGNDIVTVKHIVKVNTHLEVRFPNCLTCRNNSFVKGDVVKESTHIHLRSASQGHKYFKAIEEELHKFLHYQGM